MNDYHLTCPYGCPWTYSKGNEEHAVQAGLGHALACPERGDNDQVRVEIDAPAQNVNAVLVELSTAAEGPDLEGRTVACDMRWME